jgi:protein tyrosine phosphatase
MKMVQTPEQYIFVHKAVLEKLTCSPTRIEVAQLEPTLAELQGNDNRLGCSRLEDQFARLGKLSPCTQDDSTCRVALTYPHKNRNRDYLPIDQWRVLLKDERPDYIHASFASDHRQKEAFIIAQAPLEQTCRDFWKMVHERECGAIVMLSEQVENGRVICQRYWPTTDVELYGEYAVTPLGDQEHDSYLERAFSVTDSKTGHVHYVSQFQVLGWTSDGKASNPAAIVNCMLNVEGIQRRSGNNPAVVHCRSVPCTSHLSSYC